jgi:hypothetical protein
MTAQRGRGSLIFFTFHRRGEALSFLASFEHGLESRIENSSQPLTYGTFERLVAGALRCLVETFCIKSLISTVRRLIADRQRVHST